MLHVKPGKNQGRSELMYKWEDSLEVEHDVVAVITRVRFPVFPFYFQKCAGPMDESEKRSERESWKKAPPGFEPGTSVLLGQRCCH